MKITTILNEDKFDEPPSLFDKDLHRQDTFALVRMRTLLRNRISRLYAKTMEYSDTIDEQTTAWAVNFDVISIQLKPGPDHPACQIYVPNADQDPVYKRTMINLTNEHNRCVDLYKRFDYEITDRIARYQ